MILSVTTYGHNLECPNVKWKTFIVHRWSSYIQKHYVTQEDNEEGTSFGHALSHPFVYEYSVDQYL